ncbi:MAG: CDP-alcohol phosphatidyltransferase family protein [Myxococcota bacterium]
MPPMRLSDLWTLASAISGVRLVIACVLPFLVDGPWALPAYLLALATDVADGWVARRTGTGSDAGAALDGWLDKILHVNLAWALAVRDRVPDWFLLCWFAREILQLAMFPFLMHRFRVGTGPRPRTSEWGRATAIVLAVAMVAALVGLDATLLTLATGALGVVAGLDYARLHRPGRDRA